MKRNLGMLFSVVAVVCLLSTSAYAGDENVMYDFYNGLAEIIERNMGNPNGCLSQAESFIDTKAAKIKEIIQKAKQMASTMPTTRMNEAELERKMQEIETNPMANKMMEAISRLTKAIQHFSMKYPDHAEKLGNLIGELGGTFESYR